MHEDVLCFKCVAKEKQLGIEEIADIVGMPKIDSDQQWAVSVCKMQKGKDKWKPSKSHDTQQKCKIHQKTLANMLEIIPKTYSCVCRNALDEARF